MFVYIDINMFVYIDVNMFVYIDVIQCKEHSPQVQQIAPGTPCTVLMHRTDSPYSASRHHVYIK
jgi:hypothetical protein